MKIYGKVRVVNKLRDKQVAKRVKIRKSISFYRPFK